MKMFSSFHERGRGGARALASRLQSLSVLFAQGQKRRKLAEAAAFLRFQSSAAALKELQAQEDAEWDEDEDN